MVLVSALLPEPGAEERQAALQRAAAYALGRGVTSVVDMGRALFADLGASWRDLEQVYEVAAAAGQLPLRVRAFVPLAQWGRLATKVAAQVGCRLGGAAWPALPAGCGSCGAGCGAGAPAVQPGAPQLGISL
jgi:predicted amidohydrolase YtcJ